MMREEERSRPADLDQGWNRISWAFLALWVALLGVDRVDFLGGEAPFVLTPFLLLTPVFLAFEGVRISLRRERLRLRGPGAAYLVLLLLFLAVVLLSAFLGRDLLMSAKRSARLVIQGVGTLLVAVTVAGRPGSEKALVRGAKVGLSLALIFSVLEVMAFLDGLADPLSFGSMSLDLVLPMYEGVIPRISGPVLDANRDGLLMVFYLFLLLRWDRPGISRLVWLGLGAGMLVLTLSRSSIFAAGVAGFVALLETRGPLVSRRTVLAGMMAVASLSGWLMVDSGARAAIVREAAPLTKRFSPGEGSARDHFSLLGRGVEEATHSVRRAGIGLGYGNAHMVLQDFFPGNKYGNFHSLYLTTLVESGVFALVLASAILLGPLFLAGPFRPLLAGFVAYNVFYETPAEPLFWFSLAMAWLTLRAHGGGEETPGLIQ